MRILVFGSTGGTGRQVVQRALAEGHEVTAFARNPASLDLTHERLKVAKGDALDAASVHAAMPGHDAVICAIGPRKGTPPQGLISGAVKNQLAAMQAHGVNRLVFESGLMVGDAKGLGVLGRGMISLFRSLNRALYEDKVIAEKAIFDSPVRWTVVRPPNLSHTPGTGRYRVGVDLDVRLTKAMPHADVADYLVKAAADEQTVRQVLDLSA